jgi:dienelactone hydrolase
MRGGCLSRLAVSAMVVVAAYAVGLLLGPPVLTATRTTLLLAEMVELPVRPLALVTAEPRRVTLTYGNPADRLDVYLPAEASARDPRPAVILALGVHPQPIDSADVVRIASAIARIGVVVGVPDSTALRELRLEPTEPAHLADAVLAVAALEEVDHHRLALAGFSAGASMALVAASDERLRGRLTYVSAFGGYADAGTLLVDVASRSMLLEGDEVGWSPDEGIERDLRALATDAVGTFAAERLFGATSRRDAEALIEALPADARRLLAGVSPLDHLAGVRAPVYLLHGVTDSAIPVSHAYVLSDALGERLARLTIFGRFGHGQPGEDGLGLDDLPDLWALLLHLHDIVAATTE